MRCINCSADIPPEFVKAIELNTCPGCGEHIMDTTAKELMDELADALKRMPNNPQGVVGWLLSNYQFKKIGDAKPVEKFHEKQDQPPPEQQQKLKVANNPVKQFLERTGMNKQISETNKRANSKIAQMARVIAEGDIDEEMYGGGAEEYEEEEDYEEDYSSPAVPRAKAIASASDMYIDPKVKPLTPEEIAMIGNAAPEDDSDAQQILKAQRLARVRSQSAVLNGTGAFRRS